MSFPRYEAYKDSGVEWLGQIPLGWKLSKFRHVFPESDEKVDSTVVGPMLSVSGYRGIEIKEYDDENRRRLDDELVGYRIVRPGQLVVNTMWLNYAGLGVSAYEGHVSPAYRSYWIGDGLSRSYLHHLMRSAVYVQGYTQLLTGIRPNSLQMSRDDLMSFPVVLPPVDQQVIIAAFLDRETAKIDALIAEQERLIALLKEKRQAVISQAVTKGLDPNAPMKSSGIEWLGEVPADWEVSRLKRVCSLLKDGTHLPPPRVEQGVPLLSVRNVEDGQFALREDDSMISEDAYAGLCRSFVPQPGDVLLAIVGATLGKTAIIPDDLGPFHIQRSLAVFRPGPSASPSWVNLVFRSDGFQRLLWENVGYSAQPGIYLGTLADFHIPVPSSDEQTNIAQRLSEQIGDLDALITEANSAIALLEERRSALISAAVTGKIDVRGLVPQTAEAA